MSTSAVLDALREHQAQILRLCQYDKELKRLKFVQAWLKEASRQPSTRRSRSLQPDTRPTPASSTSTSTPAVTTPTPTLSPEPTPAPHECETMARTKASIKLAQRRAKALLSPPHPSELDPITVDPEGDEVKAILLSILMHYPSTTETHSS
jgi:hypothetical protein